MAHSGIILTVEEYCKANPCDPIALTDLVREIQIEAGKTYNTSDGFPIEFLRAVALDHGLRR